MLEIEAEIDRLAIEFATEYSKTIFFSCHDLIASREFTTAMHINQL